MLQACGLHAAVVLGSRPRQFYLRTICANVSALKSVSFNSAYAQIYKLERTQGNIVNLFVGTKPLYKFICRLSMYAMKKTILVIVTEPINKTLFAGTQPTY